MVFSLEPDLTANLLVSGDFNLDVSSDLDLDMDSWRSQNRFKTSSTALTGDLHLDPFDVTLVMSSEWPVIT